VGVLCLAGVHKEAAVTFALLYHAIHVVPVTVVGLAVVSRLGVTLSDRSKPPSTTSA
jgi:hypothetical protein